MKNTLVIENSQGNLIVNINDGEHIFHLNKSLEYFPSKHETSTGEPMGKTHWDERVNHAYPKTPYPADDTIIKRLPHLLSRRKKYLKRIQKGMSLPQKKLPIEYDNPTLGKSHNDILTKLRNKLEKQNPDF